MWDCSKLRGQKAGHCLYDNPNGEDHLEPDAPSSKVTSFQGQPPWRFLRPKKAQSRLFGKDYKGGDRAERRGLRSQDKLRISAAAGAAGELQGIRDPATGQPLARRQNAGL